MLKTFLTREWGLRYPIIGAPMAGVAFGGLARAVSLAGGLGMFGVGSGAEVGFVGREAEVARGSEGVRFGVGTMAWALGERGELFEAVVGARPFMVSVSFGDFSPWVGRLKQSGIKAAVQVHSREEAVEAERAGADLIVAQGTEAGGHTGRVGTLPLLQIVLGCVRHTPVVAAGGIATARGVAGVIAMGAEGAWVGTALLATHEGHVSEAARKRIVAARETQTVQTSVYDRVQGLGWPGEFPGRAVRNGFVDRWHGKEEEMVSDAGAVEAYRRGKKAGDLEVAELYAGEAVGLVDRERGAGEVVRELGEGAEGVLREGFKCRLSNEE